MNAPDSNRPDAADLRAVAGAIVRLGLNLRTRQRLLIAEPYEMHGVVPEAAPLIDAIREAAAAAGGSGVEVIWADPPRLRKMAVDSNWQGFGALVAGNARKLASAVRAGDALLFLLGSHSSLLDGVPAAARNRLRTITWERNGAVIQSLVEGATNWTLAPAPEPAWAERAYPQLPSEQRGAALWEDVRRAMRLGGRADDPAALEGAWLAHIESLETMAADLNRRRHRTMRLRGGGTDLKVALPADHCWCTARLCSERDGESFVANLPTEEVFTAPECDSTEGIVRVDRPVGYGGSVIEGIELEFHRGAVVRHAARSGASVLAALLDTDRGSRRLGEVAIVPADAPLAASRRLYHHPLLDENASSHVALGHAYSFTSRRPESGSLNRSLIHLDLPVDVGPAEFDAG